MNTKQYVPAVQADGWPACPTPDCGNKVCRWAGTDLCHPCSERALGKEEMERRYRITRAPDGSWNGVVP
jgi:hypothetical protein